MRPPLVAALLVSLVLIIGATWLRFSQGNSQYTQGLIAENIAPTAAVQTDEDLTSATTTTQSASSTDEKLTQTDLIGRQLFSDYLDLSSNGAATQENVAALASKYADNIANLGTSESKKRSDLTVVSDLPKNFQTYANNLAKIYNKYQTLMGAVLGKGQDADTLGPNFIKFSSELGSLYEKQAAEYVRLSVPSSLADDEVKLINNYLSTAAALKSLSNVNSDPAGGFAGILTQQKNNKEEVQILTDIGNILSSNGIISTTS